MNMILLLLCITGSSSIGASQAKVIEKKLPSESFLSTLVGHTERVRSASFSPDGTTVVTASSDGTAKLWTVHTEKCLHTLIGHSREVFSASFSPDGTKIVTASYDDTARLWDVSTGTCLKKLKSGIILDDEIYSASFSPDGTKVVTASWFGTARLWDAHTGKYLKKFKGHTGTVLSASFSPDGTWVVTASSDGTARLWNVHAGTCLRTIQGHSREVRSASFSPDGTTVVTASSDGTARLWDVLTGTCLRTIQGHSREVRSASFSPDGTTVVTASSDGTARLWDVSTGTCLRTIQGHNNDVNSASFSPDGTSVVTASDDRTARIWLLHEKQESRSPQTINVATQQPLADVQYPAVPTRTVVALSPFTSTRPTELSFQAHDVFYVLKTEGSWLYVQNATGTEGWIPANYVADNVSSLARISSSSSASTPSTFSDVQYPAVPARTVVALSPLSSAHRPTELSSQAYVTDNVSSSNRTSSPFSVARPSALAPAQSSNASLLSVPSLISRKNSASLTSFLDNQSLARQKANVVANRLSSNDLAKTPTIVINSVQYLQDPTSRQQIDQVNASVVQMQNVIADYQLELLHLGVKTDKNAAEIEAMNRRMMVVESAMQSQLLHKQALQEFAAHSNLRIFYHTLMCLIESAFLSYKAAGGGIAATQQATEGTKEKALGVAATGVRILGSVLSFFPGADLVSKAVGGVMDGVKQAMVDKLNKEKEILIQRVTLLMGTNAASEVAITVAYHLTQAYAEQLKSVMSPEDFDREMGKINLNAPPLKKRAMVIAKLLGKAGKELVLSESRWNDFVQQVQGSIKDESANVDWGTLCSVSGKFVVGLVAASDVASSCDMIPLAQAAAEYAALHILKAITTLRGNMNLQQMIEHLEKSVYELQARENSQSDKSFFSALIAKVKSTVTKETSISLLFRMFDSKEIKEINVHDLFALPGVNVAGQLFSGELCNPSSFGYIQGTAGIVSFRSANIESSSSSGKHKHDVLPHALPRIETNTHRAWKFLDQAVDNKALSPVEEATLRTMIAEQKSTVIECCTSNATYASVLKNWKSVVNAQPPSSSSALSSKTVDLISLALDLISQAFQRQLISREEKVQLISSVAAEDKFILGSIANSSLDEIVERWKIYVSNRKS